MDLKQAVKRFNLGDKVPRCPLCEEWMERKWEPARGFFIFACDTDNIAIRVDDPFVGRWDEALEKSGEKLPCLNPRCDATPMRYFATSTGYMKAKCPKCGATMSAAETDRDKNVERTPDDRGVLQ